MSITVRPARATDVPDILTISNWAAINTAANFAVEPESLESWQEEFRETQASFPWLVAAGETGAIVGFAKASPWKGRCAYTFSVEVTVYVHPDHHGRRIGTALYGELLPTLETQGYRTALAGITIPNPASVALHEAFGFRRTALFRQVGWKFDTWHDVAYWQVVFGNPDTAPEQLRPVAEAWDQRRREGPPTFPPATGRPGR